MPAATGRLLPGGRRTGAEAKEGEFVTGVFAPARGWLSGLSSTRMTRILHGASNGCHHRARGARARCLGRGAGAQRADDVAAGAGHGPPRTHAELWRRPLLGVERRVGRARAHHRARRISSTPTSSIRIDARSPSPRPTSAPGTLAVPIWWRRSNPFAAHNSVVLFAFAAVGHRHVAPRPSAHRRRRAPQPRRCCLAFCPYVFAHTAHIQLLMVGGHPAQPARCSTAWSMRRRPRAAWRSVWRSPRRRCRARTTASSAGLTIGYATLFYAWSRRLWTTGRYWIAIAIAAASSIVIVLPFFLPFLADPGRDRLRALARRCAAVVGVRAVVPRLGRARARLDAAAHRRLEQRVLFPGFVVDRAWPRRRCRSRLATGRPRRARRHADRETALLYGSIGDPGVLGVARSARWALHALLQDHSGLFVPARARAHGHCRHALPRRSCGVCRPRALPRASRPRRRAIAVDRVRCRDPRAERVPFDWRTDEPFRRVYRVLAQLPRGPVAEFPFYDRRIDFHIHTRYMLNSTVALAAAAERLQRSHPGRLPDAGDPARRRFPRRDSFNALKERRVRYITLNRGRQGTASGAWPDIERRLQPYLPTPRGCRRRWRSGDLRDSELAEVTRPRHCYPTSAQVSAIGLGLRASECEV